MHLTIVLSRPSFSARPTYVPSDAASNMRWKDGLWVILLIQLPVLTQIAQTQSTGASCLLSTLDVPNAEFDTNSTDVNNTNKVLIRCKSGFTSTGAEFITCLDGKWEGSASCVTVCKPPKPPDVGALVNPKDTYEPGERVKISCPSRTFAVTCQEDKSWSGMNSRCFNFDVNITIMEVIENGNITLLCASSKNNMKDRISWLHKSKKKGVISVAETSVKYIVNSQGNLELSNLHLDEDGMFMCLVENSSNQVKGVTAYTVKVIANQNEQLLDRADNFLLNMEPGGNSYFSKHNQATEWTVKKRKRNLNRKHLLTYLRRKTRHDALNSTAFPVNDLNHDDLAKKRKKKIIKIIPIWEKGGGPPQLEGIPNEIQITTSGKDIKSTLDKAVNKADTSILESVTEELNDMHASALKGQRFLQHFMAYLHKRKKARSVDAVKIDETVGALLIKMQNIVKSALQLKDKAKYLGEYDFTFKLLHAQLTDIYTMLSYMENTAQILKHYTQNKQTQIEIDKLNEDFLGMNVAFYNVIRKLRTFGIEQLIQMGLSTNIFQRAIADITNSIKPPLKELFSVNLDVDRAIAERKQMNGKTLIPTLSKIYRALKPLMKKVKNMKPSLIVLFHAGTTQSLVTKEVCGVETTLKRGLEKFDEINDYLSRQEISIHYIRLKLNDLYAQLKTVWVRTTEITKKFVTWLDATLSIDYVKQDTSDALSSIDKSLENIEFLTADIHDVMNLSPTMKESQATKSRVNNDLFMISQPLLEANAKLSTFSLYISKMRISNSSFAVVEEVTSLIRDSLKHSLLTLNDLQLKDAKVNIDTAGLVSSDRSILKQFHQIKEGALEAQNHLQIFSQLLFNFQNVLNDAFYLELSADVAFRAVKSIKLSVDKSIRHITKLKEDALNTLSSNTLMDPVKLKPEMHKIHSRFSITLYKIKSLKKLIDNSCRTSSRNNAFMLHFDAISSTAQNSLYALDVIDSEIKKSIVTEKYLNVISVANRFKDIVQNFRTIDAHVDGLKTTITVSAMEKVKEDMYKNYITSVTLDFQNGVTQLEYLLVQDRFQDNMTTVYLKIKGILDTFNNGMAKLNFIKRKLEEDNSYLIGVYFKQQIQIFYTIIADALASIQKFVNGSPTRHLKADIPDSYWFIQKLPQIKDMFLFGVDTLKNIGLNTDFAVQEQIMDTTVTLEYDSLLSTVAKAKNLTKYFADAAQRPSHISITELQQGYLGNINFLVRDANTRLAALDTAINMQEKLPADFSNTHTLLLTFLNTTQNLEMAKSADKDFTTKSGYKPQLDFVHLYNLLHHATEEIDFKGKTFSAWCQSRTTFSATREIIRLLKNSITSNMKYVEEIHMTIPTPQIRNWYSKTFATSIMRTHQKFNNILTLAKTVGKFWSAEFRSTIGAPNERELTKMLQFSLVKGVGRLDELNRYTERSVRKTEPMDTQKLFNDLTLFLIDMEIGLKNLKTMDTIIEFVTEYGIPFDAGHFNSLINAVTNKLHNTTSEMKEIALKFSEWPKTAQIEYKAKLAVQVDALLGEFVANENILKMLGNNMQVAAGFGIFPDTMKQIVYINKLYTDIKDSIPKLKNIKEKIQLSQQNGESLNLKEISSDFVYFIAVTMNTSDKLKMIAADLKNSVKLTPSNIISTIKKDLYYIQETLPDEIQEWEILRTVTKSGEKLNDPLTNITTSLTTLSNILKKRQNLLQKTMQHIDNGIKSEFGYDFSQFEEYVTTLMRGVKARQILTKRHIDFFTQEIQRAQEAGKEYKFSLEIPRNAEKYVDYNIPEQLSLPTSFTVDVEQVLKEAHLKIPLLPNKTESSSDWETGKSLAPRQINQPVSISIDVEKVLAEASLTSNNSEASNVSAVKTNASPGEPQQFTQPAEMLITDIEKREHSGYTVSNKVHESTAVFIDVEKTLKDAKLEVPFLPNRIETGYVVDAGFFVAPQVFKQPTDFLIDVENALKEANLEVPLLPNTIETIYMNGPVEIDVESTLKQAKLKVPSLVDETETMPIHANEIIKEWQKTFEETRREIKLSANMPRYIQAASGYAISKRLNSITHKLNNVAKTMDKINQEMTLLSSEIQMQKLQGKLINSKQFTKTMLSMKQEVGVVNSELYELLLDVSFAQNTSAGTLEMKYLANALVTLQTYLHRSATGVDSILKLTSPLIPVPYSQQALSLESEFYKLKNTFATATPEIKNVKERVRKKLQLIEIELLENMESTVTGISKSLNTTIHTLKEMYDKITGFEYDMNHYDETYDGKKDGTVKILTPSSLIKMDVVKDSNDMFNIQITPMNITKGVISATNVDEYMTHLTTQFKTSMVELSNLYKTVNVTVSSLTHSNLRRFTQNIWPLEDVISTGYQLVTLLQQEATEMLQESINVNPTWLTANIENEIQFMENAFQIVFPMAIDLQQEVQFKEFTTLTHIRSKLLNIRRMLTDCLNKVQAVATAENNLDLMPKASAGLISIPYDLMSTRDDLKSLEEDFRFAERAGMHVNATELAYEFNDMEFTVTNTLENVQVITQKLKTAPKFGIQVNNFERIYRIKKAIQPIFIITENLQTDVQIEYARIEVKALKDIVKNAKLIRRKLSDVLYWLSDAKTTKKMSASKKEIAAKFKFIRRELQAMQRNIEIAYKSGMETKLRMLSAELFELAEAVNKTEPLLNQLGGYATQAETSIIYAKQIKSTKPIMDFQSAVTIIQNSFNQLYGIEIHANLELRKNELVAIENISQEIALIINDLKIVLGDISALRSTITTFGLYTTSSEVKSVKIIQQRLKNMQRNLARIFVNFYISDLPENFHTIKNFRMIKFAVYEAIYIAENLVNRSSLSVYNHRYDVMLATDIQNLYMTLQPISFLVLILQHEIDVWKQYIYTEIIFDVKKQIDNLNVTFNNINIQFETLNSLQKLYQRQALKIHLQTAPTSFQMGLTPSEASIISSYLFYVKEGVDSLYSIMTYLEPYLEVLSETNLYTQLPQLKQSILSFWDVIKILRRSINEVVRYTEYTIKFTKHTDGLKYLQNMKNAMLALKDGTDLMYELVYDMDQELKEIDVMIVLQLQQYIYDTQARLRKSLVDLDRVKREVEKRDFQYIDITWEEGVMIIGNLQYNSKALATVKLLIEAIEYAQSDSNKLLKYARSQVALIVALELNFDTSQWLTYLNITQEIIEENTHRAKKLLKQIAAVAHGQQLNKAMFVQNVLFLSEQIEYILNNIRLLTDDTFKYLMYIKYQIGRGMKLDLTYIQQDTNRTLTKINTLGELTLLEGKSLFNASEALSIEFAIQIEIRSIDKTLLEMSENLNIAKLADKELNTTQFIYDFEKLQETRKTITIVLENLVSQTRSVIMTPNSLNLTEFQTFVVNITELFIVEMGELTDLLRDTLFMFWGIQLNVAKIKNDFELILSVLRSSICNEDGGLFQGDTLIVPGKPINITGLSQDIGNVLSTFKNSIPVDRPPETITDMKAQLTTILRLTNDTVSKEVNKNHILTKMNLPKGTNVQLLQDNLDSFFRSLSNIAGVEISDDNMLQSGGAKINLTDIKGNFENVLSSIQCDGKCRPANLVNRMNVAELQNNTNAIFNIIDANNQRLAGNSQPTENSLAETINLPLLQSNVNSMLRFVENGFSSSGNSSVTQGITPVNVTQTKYDLQQIFKALTDLSDSATLSIPLATINENLSTSDLQTIQGKMDFLFALTGNMEQDQQFDLNSTLLVPPAQAVNLTDVKRGMEYVLDFIEQASLATDVAEFISMASTLIEVQNSFDTIFNLLDTQVCPTLNNAVTAKQFLGITKPNVDVTEFKSILDKIFAFVKHKLKEDNAINFQKNLENKNMSMLIELLNSDESSSFPVIDETQFHRHTKTNQDVTELQTHLPGTWHLFVPDLSNTKNGPLINDIQQSINDMNATYVKSQLDNFFSALQSSHSSSGYTAVLLPGSKENLPNLKLSSKNKQENGISQSVPLKTKNSVVQKVVSNVMKSVLGK